MKREFLSVLAASMFLMSMLGCVSSGSTESIECIRGDFRDPAVEGDPQFQAVMNGLHQDWLEDAVRCEIGDYVFLVPVDASRHQYRVLRKDQPEVIRLDDNEITVLDGYFVHASVSDRDKDGHSDTLDYATWRYDGARYVDAVDWNLDGQPDLRTMEKADGSTTTEAWVSERWHRVILKNGFRLASEPETRLQRGEDGSFLPIESTDTRKP